MVSTAKFSGYSPMDHNFKIGLFCYKQKVNNIINATNYIIVQS